MHVSIKTVASRGIDIIPVEVQVHVANGFLAMDSVELADKAVADSREQVRAALASIKLALLNHLRGSQMLTPPGPEPLPVVHQAPDMSDLKGQGTARRVLEIAVAGQHNLLLVGPPGARKLMLAARIPGLLPTLSSRKALDVTMPYSLSASFPPAG